VHRRFLVIDIIAALVIVGGIAVVAVALVGRGNGPKATAFPTRELTQAPTPTPSSTSAAAQLALGNWPTYGFDAARTRFNPAVGLRPPFRVKWRFKAGDLLEFPPSIYDGLLYFCTEHTFVYCLDANTGHIRWRYRLPRGSQFAATPAIDATSVYVTSLAGRLLVLNRLTGKLRWGFSGMGRSESSPLLWQGRVFFGSEDGNVYAMSLATHKLVWRYQTGGAVKGAPAELGGRIVVGSYNGALYCLSYNGHLLWRRATGGVLSSNQFYATPALAYDTAYIGGTGGDIYAFDLSNGGLRWSFATGGWVYSSPAVWRNLVFEGSYDDYFYALTASSGRVVWRFYAGGSVSGSPTVVDGVVYVSSFAGRTWGLDARTGRVVWRFPFGKYSPVTADRQTLYVNGAHTLFALVPRG
jgi:outer membrane protein assembly factor BamB